MLSSKNTIFANIYLMRPPMGYLGDGRLGLNFGRFGRFDPKYFGRWENDLLEMGAGSTIFPTIFFHFCQILAVLGHFNQYNHEKSTKIKIILEIWVVKVKKYKHPRWSAFLWTFAKKGRKFSFYLKCKKWENPVKKTWEMGDLVKKSGRTGD